MEQEPVLAAQDAEDDVALAAARGALEEILDRIDCQHASPPSPSVVCSEHLRLSEANPKPPGLQATSEELDVEAEPPTSDNQTQVDPTRNLKTNTLEDEAVLSVPLPHEGQRWCQLRKQIVGSGDFKEYLRRSTEDSSWSIDEAFASFCLDRVEEMLSVAKQTDTKQQGKKSARRKGQPKKYERRQAVSTEHSSERQVRKRRGQENGLNPTDEDVGLNEDGEEEDEDLLAMNDNPKDLDYQPLPMIRYPKRRRKILPRAINNCQSQTKMPSGPKSPAKTAKSPRKAPPSLKKATKPRANATKLEMYGAPRKRGRPRKPATESTKKFPKIKVKAEKPVKTYIRMEVRLQRLPKMYECKTCFEQFPEAEEVKTHFLSTHHRDRLPVQPQNVEGGNPNPGRAEMDRLLAPDIVSLANLLRQCPKCKKYVENMTVHKREHRERNFICEECGKGFTENQILQKHKKVHEMDRTGDRYKCQLCDKSYRFSQNLRSHMLYHGGEKTFICDHCGKSFYTNNRLIIHSAIHMKEKPFKCSECGRGFSQKSNMQKHERVHTGVKPYQCDLCKESFNHKVSLKNHKKKHHGIDWWQEAGRPKPATTRKPKEPPQTVVANRDESVPKPQESNTVPCEKDSPVTQMQWKGSKMTVQRGNNVGNQWRDERVPVQEAEPAGSAWHQPESNLNLDQPNHPAAEEAVRLQTLHQAGNQWKGNNMPLDHRPEQRGEQGMTAFFYPSTYLQGYPSGYSGMPIVPINPDGSVPPATRPNYQ